MCDCVCFAALKSKSVRELKAMAKRYSIDIRGVVEKSDLVNAVVKGLAASPDASRTWYAV